MKFDFNTMSKWAGYSGNSQADMMDVERESAESVKERFLCTECACVVYENNWVAKNNCCKYCLNDKDAK